MNFISNVLDSIPVVGHVKAVGHYAVGDSAGGHRALYQSSRTAAVLAGGAAGSVAGPSGAVLGAMYTGLATDLAVSMMSGEPQGIVDNVADIVEDIAVGRNPVKSIISTGVQIAADGAGGLGMGGVSNAAIQSSAAEVTKSIAKKTSKTVVKTVMAHIISMP